jgi:hypothetical protein
MREGVSMTSFFFFYFKKRRCNAEHTHRRCPRHNIEPSHDQIISGALPYRVLRVVSMARYHTRVS